MVFFKRDERPDIKSVIYSFGSPWDRSYGNILLRQDGSIGLYSNYNESFWKIDDGKLLLLSKDNIITSEFTFDNLSNSWQGRSVGKRWPLYLTPIIEVSVERKDSTKSILVNSIPKSGTYFLESILHDLDYTSTKLHVSGNDTIHDNRGDISENIHFDPNKRHIRCNLTHLSTLLSGSKTVTVGHIEDQVSINAFIDNDFVVISMVRDLRDVLVSLMRFKEKTVKIKSPADALWRSLHGSDKLTAFISHYHEKDIRHIIQVTNNILNFPETIVKYEDLVTNKFNRTCFEGIEKIAHLENVVSSNINKNTSTYSGKRTRYQEYWNDAIECYFEESGLKKLNERLGYT
ncbi:sulfotransferase domain-containing protein [Vibrio mediterranei]|uniref:sulfotransferase domain-containing protein n=1 Tax=Vibrio mediterranei TaxID=689 RepID=UPI004067E05F